MKTTTTLGLILSVLCLTGCNHITRAEYLKSRENDYLKSRLIAPVRVPAGLTPIQESTTYPLPSKIPMASELKPVKIEPPGFGKLN